MEVVCGPRVLVVVHRRRKDHGKDLKLSQPMLRAKEEKKKKRREEGDIKRCIWKRGGKQQDGKDSDIDRKKRTEIREEK